MKVGSKLRKSVKVDDTTLLATRGRYVRVCIEIDLQKPLIPIVRIMGREQSVEYEGLH